MICDRNVSGNGSFPDTEGRDESGKTEDAEFFLDRGKD